MLLAAPLGEAPRDVAARLRAELEGGSGRRRRASSGSRSPGPASSTSSSPTPGTGGRWPPLAAAGERLGPAPAASPERILVEFVSANPTGPLHVGGGRHAAYGDALVRLLEAAGHEVEREYYVNDAGGQVERFADSIAARMRGERAARGRLRGRLRRRAGRAAARRGRRPGGSRRASAARRSSGRCEGCGRRSTRFGVALRHLVLGARLCTQRRGRGGRSSALARARPHLRAARARSGCAPPTSATTRTGC